MQNQDTELDELDDDYPRREIHRRHPDGTTDTAAPPLPPPPEPEADEGDEGDATAADVDEVLAAAARVRRADDDREKRRAERVADDPRGRAAAALGMPPADVVRVRRRRGGLLVQTVDGAEMIVVPPDRPDAEGRSGVLLWRRPSPRHRYPMPVYARKACPAEVVEAGLCPHRPGAPSDAELESRWAQLEAERARAEEERARAEAEKVTGEEPWADAMLQALLALHAEEAERVGTRQGTARRAVESLQLLIRWRANRLRGEWEAAQRPAIEPEQVEQLRLVVMMALDVIDVRRRRGDQARALQWWAVETGNLAWLDWGHLVDHELAAATVSLEGAGLPVPTLEDAAAYRAAAEAAEGGAA